MTANRKDNVAIHEEHQHGQHVELLRIELKTNNLLESMNHPNTINNFLRTSGEGKMGDIYLKEDLPDRCSLRRWLTNQSQKQRVWIERFMAYSKVGPQDDGYRTCP